MKKLIIGCLFSLAFVATQGQVTHTLGLDDYTSGTETLYESPNGGYAFGNNGYGDRGKAQSFRFDQSFVLREVLLKFGAVEFNSADPESTIMVNVYSYGGAGVTMASVSDSVAPDTIIASVEVPINQLADDGSLFAADFTSEMIVFQANQPFFVGITFDSLAVGDTLGLYSTTDGDANEASASWELTSANNWVVISQSAYSWDLDIDLAIFPTIDVNDPAGLRDAFVDNLVSVYPNPFTDYILIENLTSSQSNKDGLFELYNSFGQLVLKQPLKDNQTGVDLQNIKAGVYTLTVYLDEVVSSQRIVKVN